jgi:hypothetical protein
MGGAFFHLLLIKNCASMMPQLVTELKFCVLKLNYLG